MSRDSEQYHLEALAALLSAVEVRDRYTAGHSLRVAETATFIGGAMGLKDDVLHILQYAALLHDLGKIGLPESILNKNGRLTDEEWQTCRLHPEQGVRIAEALTFLNECLSAIMYHHERYDGRGYPDGLRMQQIPLEARILHIADSLDAMCTNRPYRRALSRYEIMLELEHGLGADFDPQVVTALFNIGLEEFLKKRVETEQAVVASRSHRDLTKAITAQDLQALLGLPPRSPLKRFFMRFRRNGHGLAVSSKPQKGSSLAVGTEGTNKSNTSEKLWLPEEATTKLDTKGAVWQEKAVNA